MYLRKATAVGQVVSQQALETVPNQAQASPTAGDHAPSLQEFCQFEFVTTHGARRVWMVDQLARNASWVLSPARQMLK